MKDLKNSMSGGELLLRSLKAQGMDHFLANAGSDFAPIVEAYARVGSGSPDLPEPVIVPHESALVGMAHGYWLATGRPQAAMVHVNVGLANAAMAMINARADDVPVLLMSGRTPLTEHDRPGARRTPIQYGQEQFDQASLVRDVVKWHFELRYPETVPALLSRALAVAKSAPEGPVYLSLPREPLTELTGADVAADPLQAPSRAGAAAAEDIATAAGWLAAAENPLIICQRGDPGGRVAAVLEHLAEAHDLPVAEVFATRKVFRGTHPMAVGPDLSQRLPEADVVLVVDAPVAWIEHHNRPRASAKVIHVGPDPLHARMPMRSYRTTLGLAGDTAATLAALDAALETVPARARDSAAIAADHAAYLARVAGAARAGSTGTASKAYVAACVSGILGETGVVVSERGAPAPFYPELGANRFFGNTPAGGLGWGGPAALGVQLADRDRLVVCVVGDGSHLFANPVVCHQVAKANALPVLTVVLNNSGWDAVRLSALEVYPEGVTSGAAQVPLTEFGANPDHAQVAEACGLWARRVDRAEDLPAVLQEAVTVIRDQRLPVLLDVAVRPE
ncbi:thiamine pyrophosphate-requiring protein [Marinovum sp. SP66]|uniref:thiamine pyrophosphate-requiring protein n=1 Tax=Marinovum TaxID=367771 RepID=UPI00065B2F45|nr:MULTISPECIES: thiamine pyrophosphate-requiring protein [unclassified Marinovum]AKO99939.1 Thiamine pyrophosphate-requiring enzyme [Marinovum algicola DG 898]MDD9739659.1 thiamine pyrophosphate-requiring protein [Marinovum sp. SP66]MDD9744916.1 thiamine pyrophosphate-requiring protein [Marinovum sp. PR37]